MTTPSAGSRMVLMCGGPADGRWVTVQDVSKDYEIMEQPRIDWKANVAETVIPEPVRTRYRIFKEQIFGRGLWVGIPSDESDHRGLIMRTVLQRDVAQHLGAYR